MDNKENGSNFPDESVRMENKEETESSREEGAVDAATAPGLRASEAMQGAPIIKHIKHFVEMKHSSLTKIFKAHKTW